ncbi:hypothetical protein KKE26_03160, partial [bacterium]|nr:hypothetical protein [bacterium]
NKAETQYFDLTHPLYLLYLRIPLLHYLNNYLYSCCCLVNLKMTDTIVVRCLIGYSNNGQPQEGRGNS